jgi:ankyrin repeat protein
VHHRCKSGYQPIHLACAGGHVDTVSKLISLGARVNGEFIVHDENIPGIKKTRYH